MAGNLGRNWNNRGVKVGEHIYDLVIVGGGPAGLSAGMYGGQVALTQNVENYPGIENIGGFELCEKFLNHAKHYGLDIRDNEVTSVEPGAKHHEVVLAGGGRLHAHAVILAVGGSARKLGVPGEEEQHGKGVSYCATCDGLFFRNKTVVVVGGGDRALEDSLYLVKICEQVYLVHRRDEFRGSRILQQRVFAEEGITLMLDSVVTEIIGDNQGVTGVSIKNVKTEAESKIDADGVFIFVGFSPNNALVPSGVKMDAGGYVIADEKCGTCLPGIYVAGDLRQKYANQIVLAAADGCTAALAAASYVEMRKADRD
jgi:thioredoxin reductase (NADPH)